MSAPLPGYPSPYQHPTQPYGPAPGPGQPYPPPPYPATANGQQPPGPAPAGHATWAYPPPPAGQRGQYPALYGAPQAHPYGRHYPPPHGAIYQPPPPTAAVATVTPGSPADFWPRFGALMVDYCLLFVLWFTLLGIAAFAGGGALAVLATFLGPAAYFIGFWATTGRTPGYSAAGLQMVRTDGTKPGLGTAVVRYVGTVLSWSFFCLGYFWMLWDRDRQTWHDKIAGTRVINLR